MLRLRAQLGQRRRPVPPGRRAAGHRRRSRHSRGTRPGHSRPRAAAPAGARLAVAAAAAPGSGRRPRRRPSRATPMRPSRPLASVAIRASSASRAGREALVGPGLVAGHQVRDHAAVPQRAVRGGDDVLGLVGQQRGGKHLGHRARAVEDGHLPPAGDGLVDDRRAHARSPRRRRRPAGSGCAGRPRSRGPAVRRMPRSPVGAGRGAQQRARRRRAAGVMWPATRSKPATGTAGSSRPGVPGCQDVHELTRLQRAGRCSGQPTSAAAGRAGPRASRGGWPPRGARLRRSCRRSRRPRPRPPRPPRVRVPPRGRPRRWHSARSPKRSVGS